MLEVAEGPVEFVDTRNNKRQGKVHLKPAGVVDGRRSLWEALPGTVRDAVTGWRFSRSLDGSTPLT